MSPKEIAIAEAAIKPYSASDYEDLHKQIAQATGYSIEDVDGVIDDCTADKTLFARIEPMLDQRSPGDVQVDVPQTWYEKGQMWGQPRMILRS
jgi:hypothetical protein